MPVRPLRRAVLAALVAACGGAHADSVERGRRLLAQYQCGSCHGIPGVPSAGGKLASSLEGFGRRSYIAGRIANRQDNLARWIEQPKAFVADTAMPSMGVSPADAREMAAYLLELK